MTLDTKFDLGQKVRVKELERPGVVIGILHNGYGTKYDVRYFLNGEAKEVYFFADELEAKP